MSSEPTDPAILEAVDQQMFVFRELAHEDGSSGRTIAFTDTNVRPLNYQALAAAKLHKKLTIPLEWHNSKIVDTDISDLDKTKNYNLKAVLESEFTSRAIGLVRGRWLPSALAATYHRTTILVDRNVVSQIISRFDAGKKLGSEPDFLDLFADQPVRINPLLFVMEGNTREIPTPVLAREQLEEVVAKLTGALPSAELVVGPESLNGALGMIEDTRVGMGRRQQFLVRLAPLIGSPVSRRNMQARWDQTLSIAQDCGVQYNSLVALAALSSVVVPNGRSPAKGLLKFKVGYCDGDAYNALADLRSLEILINLFGYFPDEPAQLCTADKNLALFWTGLQASGFVRTSDGVTFDMDPVEEILPGEWGEQWRSLFSV